jgi:hypothetical protein
MIGLHGGGRTGGSIICPYPLGGGVRSSRNLARNIFNIMTEFPKRHARKYSGRARLTSYRGSRLVLINPRPIGLFSEESRGKSSKFHPKSYKQQQDKQNKERQKVFTKSKTTYRRG